MTSAGVPVRTSGSSQGLFPPPESLSSYIIHIASCYLKSPFSSQLRLHPNSEWRESAPGGGFEQKARGTEDPPAALPKEGRLHVEECLEDLTGQHKDPWEFHMLKQRLAWEIRALQSSKEQLLTEGSFSRQPQLPLPTWAEGQELVEQGHRPRRGSQACGVKPDGRRR
eukprot:XP_028333486.1 synaptonemal complex central element protein 1-like isoform X3 [Physeter catodon]